jgi:transposase
VSRQQKPSRQVSVDERIQVVLAVLKGELSLAEAARRHGVSSATVGNWRDRFVDAGKAGMDRSLPGPDGGQSQTERRLRHECEQLKLGSRGGDGAAADLAERLGVRRRCPFAALRWDSRTNLLVATSPPPRRRPAERAMAGAESGRDRGSRREVRSGLARLGAPQDRRDDACRRPLSRPNGSSTSTTSVPTAA